MPRLDDRVGPVLIMSPLEKGSAPDVAGSGGAIGWFEDEIIILCLRWYFRYKLSYQWLVSRSCAGAWPISVVPFAPTAAVADNSSNLNHEVTPSLLRSRRLLNRKVMDDQEALIGLVADGKLLCSRAARALNVAPAELLELLNDHAIVSLGPTADERQAELEAAAFRTQLTSVEK
jgi:hypothetical protein